MKNTKRITIKDVAAEAGVSVATISLVMRDMGSFPEETRKHVKSVAAKMGYTANRRAASFRTGKSKTIGFVIPDTSNEGWVNQWTAMLSQTLLKIVVAASKRGYAIVALPPDSPEMMKSFGLDAIILNDSRVNDPDIDHAYRLGIPIVTYDRPSDLRLAVHLDTGYAPMTIAALDALKAAGSVKPGLLTEPGGMASNTLQVDTYLSWCKKNRTEPVVIRGSHDRHDLDEKVSEIVDAGCDSLYSFYGEGPAVLKFLQQKKISVPQKFQFITAHPYDGEENRALKISTTVYHPEEMIDKPLNVLIDAIEGKIETPSTYSAPWEIHLYPETVREQ